MDHSLDFEQEKKKALRVVDQVTGSVSKPKKSLKSSPRQSNQQYNSEFDETKDPPEPRPTSEIPSDHEHFYHVSEDLTKSFQTKTCIGSYEFKFIPENKSELGINSVANTSESDASEDVNQSGMDIAEGVAGSPFLFFFHSQSPERTNRLHEVQFFRNSLGHSNY